MSPAKASRVTLPERIQTPRLLLRPWALTDAPLLKAAIDGNLDHLRTWMDWANKEPSSLKVIEQRIERFDRTFRSGSEWLYAVFSVDESALYGGAGLHPRIGRGGLEIGYWLQQGWTKQGYATEAVTALAEIAFRLPDTQRVQIRCDPRNALSAAVARRAGFRHLTTLPKETSDPKGAPRDTMVWEVTRSTAVKAVGDSSAERGRSAGAAALSLVGWLMLGMGTVLSVIAALGLKRLVQLQIRFFGFALDTRWERIAWISAWAIVALVGILLLRMTKPRPQGSAGSSEG